MRLAAALARFDKEARRGVCDTGRYRCRYYVWGDGPPLLFIHGLVDSGLAFVLPIVILSRWFRCLAYDLPAGGADGATLRRHTHADLIEDVWALLDHLDVPRSYVFAAGFGTTVALAAMRARPERLPRAVLHAAVAYKPLARFERFCAWLMSHCPGPMSALPLRKRLMERLHRRSFEDRPPELWVHFLRYTGMVPTRCAGRRARLLHGVDSRPWLGEVRQPILLVDGDKDPVARPGDSELLLNALPNAGRVVLPNSGHAPMLTHPEALAEVIRHFLTPPPANGSSSAGGGDFGYQ